MFRFEEEIRGLRFDALVRKTINTFPDAKKVFAHPFVFNPEAQLQRNLITQDCSSNLFQQNSVGKIYIALKNNGYFETFSPFNFFTILVASITFCVNSDFALPIVEYESIATLASFPTN